MPGKNELHLSILRNTVSATKEGAVNIRTKDGKVISGNPTQIVAELRRGWMTQITRAEYFCVISAASGMPVSTSAKCLAALQKLGWIEDIGEANQCAG